MHAPLKPRTLRRGGHGASASAAPMSARPSRARGRRRSSDGAHSSSLASSSGDMEEDPRTPMVPLDDTERLLTLQMALKCADLGVSACHHPAGGATPDVLCGRIRGRRAELGKLLRQHPYHRLHPCVPLHFPTRAQHTAAALPVHLRWVAALEEELFQQGDAERLAGLPISPLFDRAKQGVSKSQASGALAGATDCVGLGYGGGQALGLRTCT